VRTWHPPESPWRIDFPEDLPPRLHPGTAGLLHGHIDGSTIQIAPSGGDPVGIYISRRRGEVFLTDSDIARFEQSGAAAALVVAGEKAGFFVRSSDGSLQSIRSFEEFSVPPAHSRGVRIVARSKGIFAAALLLTILPVAGIGYLAQRRPVPPAGLTVREKGGQLLISWRPGHPALLEISDSGQITTFRFPADRCAATYIRRGADVRVKLTLANPPDRQASLFR